jgi:autotransporter-associated beta strand protein
MSTCTVSTASITPAGTYVITIVINTNPPNANVIPSTNTFTLNVGTVFVPLKTWTPAGVNTNWSTGGNWTATGVPTPSNDVLFVDLGAAGSTGQVDNVVDSTQTIGSLTYSQTNGFHTTLINPGLALTVGGDANGLSVGTGSDIGDGHLTTAGITGATGALSVTNPGSIITIDQSHTTAGDAIAQAQATLDLSGLASLNATVSRVLVGVDSTAALKGASGVLNLAQSNTITITPGSAAPQLDVGDNSQSQGSPGKASTLLLGQTNAIFADSISVGRGKTDNTAPSMSFNSIFTSPTAYFRGTNGTSSRVGTWSIGDGFGSKSAIVNANGICDFSAGSVDALVNTMFIGKGASTANGGGANVFGVGTLTISAGVMNINTLEAGFMQTVTGTGTVNVNGGSLLVNSLLELGHAGGSGTLNISGGSTILNSGATAGGGTANITMTGGTLVATNPTATLGTAVSPLTTFGIANGTLTLAVRSISPTIDTGTLNGGGLANTINISSAPVLTNVPAQFPVIQYTTPLGDLTTFVIGSLPGTYQGYISNNTTTSSIDLVVTNGPIFPVMVWDGSQNGNWDLSTFNWKTNGVLTDFQQNYPIVRFDDSLTGTTNVILTTSLTPGSLTIGNTLSNYVFTGAGSLGGSMTLLDSGSGSVTLAETGGDNFTGGIDVNGGGTVILDNVNGAISGGTTIDSGTVRIGANDANGSLPSGVVAVAGTLAINRLNTLNVTNVISGAGTISQIGTGGTILSGNNSTFSGSVSITQGTLQVGNTNGIGSSPSVTITSGTFDVGGFALFGNGNSALVVTVAGSGVGGNGAIINSGTSQTKVLHTVTMTGDTTFGGTGDWDIRNNSGNSATADAQLNGAFNLTKVNTNSISLRGVTVDGNLGNINVQGGIVTFTATASAPQNSLGNSSATITVFSNATITLDTIGNIPGKNMVLTNGGTFKSSGTNTFSSQLTLLGAANNTISVGTAAQLTITTPIGGAGGFAKNGSSTLFLNATNTYIGSTVVSGGTLALYGNALDGSISASSNINVTTGAILDVSGRSDQTLTLANGQMLSGGTGTNGVGLITGFLVMNSGATLSPGNSPTNTGVLLVSSNATLQGATIMKLNAGAGTNDLFAANALAYGGSLTVTNFNGTITNGQTFQLFIASNGVYNAASFGSVTLPSATGLTWTNNLAVNGSITAGVAATTPAQPHITSVTLTGTSLVISGTNGTPGLQFEVLSSTNVALALSNWTSIATNTFSSGNFSVTNTINPAVSPSFFILRVP